MRKLTMFNNVSLDGFFTDGASDMSWAHQDDPEWNEFVSGNASGGGVLLFGRKTYDQMVSFWPTDMAARAMPTVAERMNNGQKIVFSRTLGTASWKNTEVIHGDPVAAVRKLKAEPGEGMALLGSGTIVSLLAEADLIDEYQLVLVPVILGKGRTLFEGVTRRPRLKRTRSRLFANGHTYLCFEREAG